MKGGQETWSEGYKAYQHDLPCPYEIESLEWCQWVDGWQAAMSDYYDDDKENT